MPTINKTYIILYMFKNYEETLSTSTSYDDPSMMTTPLHSADHKIKKKNIMATYYLPTFARI